VTAGMGASPRRLVVIDGHRCVSSAGGEAGADLLLDGDVEQPDLPAWPAFPCLSSTYADPGTMPTAAAIAGPWLGLGPGESA
jgi:hypothetical protein